MKRTMLIAVSLDNLSTKAMDFCAGTRGRGIVRAILLHVLDTSGMEGPVINKAIEDAHQRLNIMAEPMRLAGIEVQIRVVTGSPTHEIMSVAQSEKVDVIVMGTSAKNIIQRIFTGSISEDIAYGQKAPTLLIRDDIINASPDAEALARDWSRKMVVPIDYSAASARAVLQCTRFEPEAVGEVRLLHVIRKVSKGDCLEDLIAEDEFRLSAFCTMLENAGLNATPVVRCGDVVEEILAEVAESGASGIVIGNNAKSALTEVLMGSTTQAILAQAPVLVMVVP